MEGFDINPMSAWIVREEIEHLDIAAYERAAYALTASLRAEIDRYYRTSCPLYGDLSVPVKSFLWVKVLNCGACGTPFDLFPGYLLAEDRRHPRNILVCPMCGDLNEVDDRKDPRGCATCGSALHEAGPARQGCCECPHCRHSIPDVAALDEFIRLWDRWVAGKELDVGLAPFKHMFAQLRTVRPWGPQDRIPDETITYWSEEARRHPNRPVRTEVELWHRRTPQRREQARLALRALVAAEGGTVLNEALIPEIAYQGVLIDIPAAAIQALVARGNVALALADDDMFLRPQTVLSAPAADALEDGAPIGHQPPATGQPIAALLDGVPLQGHERLAGRLSLDDPDDLQARALANRRFHGTAMASLILHGDLNAPEPALTRPLYVRPLMVAPADLGEHTPGDRLLVDTLYNAIVRIKEVEGQPGVAPTVFLVNLSLGDRRRPFANLVSPLARLFDFLAAKYDIVFLVSAGNVPDQLVLPEFNQWAEFEAATPQERERAVLTAMFAAKHERSLLSPAEAVNVLTIGAQHTDNVANRVATVMSVDPFDDPALPNASCAMGLGYRRAVKPDLFLPAGREHVRMVGAGAGVRVGFGPAQRTYGLGAAAPDSANLGRLNQTVYADGTSSATALATRAAHRIFDSIMNRDGGSLLTDVPPAYYAAVVKTLLVHSAR